MNKKKLISLGLMSGTSMDGINATIVETDGKSLKRMGVSGIYSYGKKTKTYLNEKHIDYSEDLNNLITNDHAAAALDLIKKHSISPDIIGFHGQTIYHNYNEKISIQLGNPDLLSKITKCDVVGNFREADLKNNGQGAPIAPIYHKQLMIEKKLDFPCCFLNIGGISNITYWDGTNLIGFDTGPGNTLIDNYVKKHFKINFDNFGKLALRGKPDYYIIETFLKINFFENKFPKSLDKNELNEFLSMLTYRNLSHYDKIATITNLTIFSIKKSITLLPETPKVIIISGGGEKNLYLINGLKKELDMVVKTANEIDLPGEMIEAELIAYLAVRRLYGLPITFPSTTGVDRCMIGGEINYYKQSV